MSWREIRIHFFSSFTSLQGEASRNTRVIVQKKKQRNLKSCLEGIFNLQTELEELLWISFSFHVTLHFLLVTKKGMIMASGEGISRSEFICISKSNFYHKWSYLNSETGLLIIIPWKGRQTTWQGEKGRLECFWSVLVRLTSVILWWSPSDSFSRKNFPLSMEEKVWSGSL